MARPSSVDAHTSSVDAHNRQTRTLVATNTSTGGVRPPASSCLSASSLPASPRPTNSSRCLTEELAVLRAPTVTRRGSTRTLLHAWVSHALMKLPVACSWLRTRKRCLCVGAGAMCVCVCVYKCVTTSECLSTVIFQHQAPYMCVFSNEQNCFASVYEYNWNIIVYLSP